MRLRRLKGLIQQLQQRLFGHLLMDYAINFHHRTHVAHAEAMASSEVRFLFQLVHLKILLDQLNQVLVAPRKTGAAKTNLYLYHFGMYFISALQNK
jgi:hypothetical protein